MKYLCDIAKAISEGVSEGEIRGMAQNRRPEIDEEIADLSDQDLSVLINQLFKQGIKFNGSFYDTLASLQHCVGYGPSPNTLIGKIWAKALKSLPEGERIKLLSSLLKEDLIGFWVAIRCFPTFSTLLELPPSYVAAWFYDLANRIGGDLAGGDFYIGITKYAEALPKSALIAFEQYMSEKLDNLKVHIAAILLGVARSKSVLGEPDKASVRKWDAKLQKNPDTQVRLVYHRSLISSFNLGTLSIPQLRRKLSQMLRGTPEEVSEAFNVVGRCLRKDKTDTKFIQFGLSWYTENASSQIPDWAKYHLISSLWLLCSYKDLPKRASIISHANDLIIAIQPILPEHQGTWEELEHYMVNLVQHEQEQAEDVLTRLLTVNPQGILQHLGRSSYLKSELSQAKPDKFVTKLLLSADKYKWEVGKTIFQDTDSDTLSAEVLGGTSETNLEIALLQFVHSPFLLGDKVSKYLSQLEPYFRNVNPDLQQRFKNELTIQAINYPQACFALWEKLEPKSELLQEATRKGRQYFDNLSMLKECPATNFSFPGYVKACEKAYRNFHSKVTKQARESSVFLSVVRSLEIIYGNKWAVFMRGNLGSESSFGQFSHSMEIPRLEKIDPEGMAIRRLQASTRIKEIKAKLG